MSSNIKRGQLTEDDLFSVDEMDVWGKAPKTVGVLGMDDIFAVSGRDLVTLVRYVRAKHWRDLGYQINPVRDTAMRVDAIVPERPLIRDKSNQIVKPSERGEDYVEDHEHIMRDPSKRLDDLTLWMLSHADPVARRLQTVAHCWRSGCSPEQRQWRMLVVYHVVNTLLTRLIERNRKAIDGYTTPLVTPVIAAPVVKVIETKIGKRKARRERDAARRMKENYQGVPSATSAAPPTPATNNNAEDSDSEDEGTTIGTTIRSVGPVTQAGDEYEF